MFDYKKYRTKRNWFQVLFGYCPWCCRYFRYGVRTRRRNTAYYDEENNYITACAECRDEDWAYFKERWDEYNSMRL